MDKTQLTDTQSIESLIKAVNAKSIVLPEFQREFVWEIDKTIDLFDSIVKDIFIGSLIYGIPSFEISAREIDIRPRKKKGQKRSPLQVIHYSKAKIHELQRIDKGKFMLILDGQQRITSIYRSLMGVDKIYYIRKNDSEIEQETLEKKADEQTIEELLYAFDTEESDSRMSISISDIWKIKNESCLEKTIRENFFKKTQYYQKLSSHESFDEDTEFVKYLNLKEKILDMFKSEKLISYYMLDISMDKFILFFERSNSKGIQLNFIDILVAKLYEGFNLKEKIKEFESKNTGITLIPELIVRTIAYIVSRNEYHASGKSIEIHRTYILTELEASHFVQYWDETTKLYKSALEFLYSNHYIISEDWIPYQNMLIPLIIFQKELNGGFDRMTQDQSEFIKNWYWSSVFSQRYTGSSNEKIIYDCNILTIIAKNGKITDRSYFVKLHKSVVNTSQDLYLFSKKQNAVYIGILNFVNYAVKGYLDWNNTHKINFNAEIDDHHIFPKDYIEKNYNQESEEADLVDCVVNKTLIPKITNIKIGNKAPSVYLKEIKENFNNDIATSLKTHFIADDLLSGDYDKEFLVFLELRAEEMYKIIKDEIYSFNDSIKAKFYKEPDWNKTIKVFAKYYKKVVEAEFNPKSGVVKYNGNEYDTPTGAGKQAKLDLGAPQGTEVNGWQFWKFIDESSNEEKFINEIRDQLQKD